MPAPSTKGRQKSTRPILEFLERGAKRKGKSIRETTFEEFMNSPAMGFGGAGAIKLLRGVPGIGVKLGGKQLSKPKGFKSKEPAKERANIDRPNTIAGGERRANVGGQRPPDTELEALALQKQQAGRGIKTKSPSRISDKVVELRRDLLRLSDEALSGRLQGTLNKADLSRVKSIQRRLKALQGLERDAKAIEKSMKRQVKKRHKQGIKPRKEPEE